jgi:cytochrome c6
MDQRFGVSRFLFAGLVTSGLLFASVVSAAESDGQKVFQGKCTQCHGKDAKGAPKMAKVLKVDPIKVDLLREEAAALSAEEMEKTVTNGKGKMPKYKGKLSTEEITAAVQYVKTLQGGGKEAPKAKKKAKKK